MLKIVVKREQSSLLELPSGSNLREATFIWFVRYNE